MVLCVEEELESRLRDTETELVESQEMVKMLSVPPPEVPGADRHELLRLLDRRQHEIDQLSEEWKSLSARLVSVSVEKSEFQTRCVQVYYVCDTIRCRVTPSNLDSGNSYRGLLLYLQCVTETPFFPL